jgi:stress response protein YsnF
MATTTRSTVIAVYRNNADAQGAAAELQANGFNARDIYISSAGTAASGGEAENRQYATHHEHEGGVTGWFKSLFGHNESDQDDYERAIRGGNVLLSVETDDQNIDAVGDILDRFNPVDVHREDSGPTGETTAARSGAAGGVSGTTAARNYGAAKSTAPPPAGQRTSTQTAAADARTATGSAKPPSTGTARTNAEGQAIPVVQEELQVGKRRVLRGGVRVYARLVEQPVEETVRLREESVRVNRERVDRPVTQGDLRPDRDQVVEVQEFAEEAVVAKQARVVEEVRIQKDANERDETVRDTVRHTEVRVEGIDAENARGTTGAGTTNFDEDYRRDFQTNYAGSGGTYDEYAPAYRYGYDMANDPRYRGRSFDEVESDLRSDYGRRYPNSAWDRFKNSIRYGWDRMTGKTKSATSR